MKQDEKDFLLTCIEECRPKGKKTPREIINKPGFSMHHKRAWYLLEKWTDKDWYEYGVCLDLGWFTEKGLKEVGE